MSFPEIYLSQAPEICQQGLTLQLNALFFKKGQRVPRPRRSARFEFIILLNSIVIIDVVKFGDYD